MAESWVEIRSGLADPQRVPRIINAAVACGEVHAFFYEPWTPAAIRVRGTEQLLEALRGELAGWDEPPEIVDWSPNGDREYFGPVVYDRAVVSFFEASTRVAYEAEMLTTSDLQLPRFSLHTKLVHCFLNAQGVDTPDEARFAKAFLRNRRKQARKDYGLFWRWKK